MPTPRATPSTPSSSASLTVAAHYLRAAAHSYDRTRTYLDAVIDMVQTLEQRGPTVGLLERLAEAILAHRESAPVPCEVDVAIEGPHVVLRIACVPEEHPELVPE